MKHRMSAVTKQQGRDCVGVVESQKSRAENIHQSALYVRYSCSYVRRARMYMALQLTRRELGAISPQG